MPTVPSSLALGTMAGVISASPHNTNYTAIQTAVNALITALGGGGVTFPKITTSSMAGGPPGSPADQDIWVATNVGANGERWSFQYNAGSASASKWEFIGGPEVIVSDDGTVTTASVAYAVPTAGTGSQLTLTAVRAGDYIVGHSGYMTNSGVNSTQVGLRASGSADANLALMAETTATPYNSEKRMNGVTAGGTIQPIVAVGAGTGTYQWRVLWARPVRIT